MSSPSINKPERSWTQIWLLAKTFFIIGGFTFGGGHAMLELIRREIVDRRHWMGDDEFIDLFAVAQSLPGIFAVNMSIFVGYRLQGVLGAIVCAISCTFPSFVIIIILAIYATKFKDNPAVEAVFKGMRPAVVALIAAPCISVWRTLRLGWKWVWVPTVVAISVWLLGISPVTMIVVAAFLGWLYTMFISKNLMKGGDKK
ncbi:chromate transporter [Porphyromonadaceae bacterium W3.11]|nr:chromate transporter [Porphyromonadaceae bacterium W3.11]